MAEKIKRDGAGYSILGETNNLLDSARKIIRQKQNMNKDLTNEEAYWRNVAGDINAYGSERDPRARTSPMVAGPRDINYRELSPSQQSSLRTSRQTAAQAHLRSLADERKFRGDTMSDTLSSLSDVIKSKSESEKDALAAQEKALDIAKKKKELGLPVTGKDLGLSPEEAVGTKLGGSDSWRYNNPTLIPYDETSKKMGAMRGGQRPGGGYYAIFPTEEDGWEAFLKYTQSGPYKDMTVAEALDKIIGPGFSHPDIENKPLQDLTEEDVDKIRDAVKDKYDWEEGSDLGNIIEEPLPDTWSEGALRSVSIDTGIPYDELKSKSNQEIIDIVRAHNNTLITPAIERKLIVRGVTREFANNVIAGLQSGISVEEMKERYPDYADKFDAVNDVFAGSNVTVISTPKQISLTTEEEG